MKERLINKEKIKLSISDGIRHFKIFLKWTVLSIFIGVVVGSFSSLFGIFMAWANDTRVNNDFFPAFRGTFYRMALSSFSF